jgi:outer membrane protein OmpA-like peptidoglycan-associated protein
MASDRPMLGEIELQLVQKIETEDDQVLAQHSVPALEGDFLQPLGRRASRIKLNGVMTGPEAAESLKTLRKKFRDGEPASFVADIATATQVDQVLIEEFGVRELAGKAERFAFELTLRELIPPPAPEAEEPPPPPPSPPPAPPSVETGTLVVEVTVEGQPSFDFGKISVMIEGRLEDNTTLNRTLTNRSNNVWTEENVPPGAYKVKAVEINPLSVSNLTLATIRAGQTAIAAITLSPGATIAKAFVVHFRFNNAFVEPCMRAVLRDVAQFAKNNQDHKLVIVGHTDRTGPEKYNQSLSERRARSVFAYLTFDRDRKASVAEWDSLRLKQPPGALTSINDSWGVREDQHMLQDLGFYPGNVDGRPGDLTRDAVRAFRCKNGLSPGTTVDDATRTKLIEAYMSQDSLAVPKAQFLPNGSDILKWLGCGEESPLPLPKPTRKTAFRPYRRVELLFVKADSLPCKVPQPDTFDLPEKGVVGASWELGPGDPKNHCCFATRECDKATPPTWCIEMAETTTITVKGSIKNEDDTPFANKKFVITTADGEFVQITREGKIKEGEHPDGEPILSRTNDKGEFAIPDRRVGVYTLEVREKVIIRLDEQTDKEAKGNAVCKALRSDKDELKVVVLNALVLREIRLPVAVHLMRGLRADTHELRTCPDASAPGGRRPQETGFFTQDDKAIRDLFDEVNKIWRQARIRFEVVDVVREAFSHPIRTECGVDEDEFKFILKHCGYPDAVNVFFFGSLEGGNEIGFGISEDKGFELGRGGSAVGDRGGGVVLDATQRVQTIAHELGHFLNLDHVDANAAANSSRLMLPGTFTGLNRTIVQTKKEPEVDNIRASKGARLECLPLKLSVTGDGVFHIGGSLSQEFIIVAKPFGTVTVKAVISDELKAEGTLVMNGGEGTSNEVRTVDPSASKPPVEISATYTTNSGSDSITTRVVIRIVIFSLDVIGAKQLAPDKFFVPPHPTDVVTIVAKIDPFLEPTKPNCIPTNLVGWTNGNEHPDPLRRTVSRAKVSTTTVKAKVADFELSLTIEIREVLLTNNIAPFDTGIELVEIKGLLNQQLTLSAKKIAQADLFKEQTDSFFRARAEIAGVSVNTVTVTAILISNGPDGKEIDRITNLTLKRNAGDQFVSDPILAIPFAIPKADVDKLTFVNFNVIRTLAGGKIRLQRTPTVTNSAEFSEVTVHGRVVFIFAQTFTNAATTAKDLKATAADIRRQIQRANRIWAQAGVEVKERSIRDAVPDPDKLLDLDTNDDPNKGKTDEEKRLLGEHPDCAVTPAVCATRSPNAKDLNIYYLHDIKGPAAGLAYGGTTVIAIEAPSVTDNALAHEIGHQILIDWACKGDPPEQREHKDPSCTFWPSGNVMHQFDTEDSINVDKSQTENIVQNSKLMAKTHPIIVFEP